jgi:6-phosphogluconolactonase
MPPSREVCERPAERVAEIVRAAAEEAIDVHGYFTIAIAGGSLVKMLGAMAGMENIAWDKWHVAWVDERCVLHADAESNYGGAVAAWLSKVPIPRTQVFAIDETLCTPESLAADGSMAVATAAAESYEKLLRAVPDEVLPRGRNSVVRLSGLPAFDLLLIGFGPDGHICSLFPGHPLLTDESDWADGSARWILPIGDSPKPPPARITFSLPVVNSAVRVVLVGTGEGKKEIVRDAFAPGSTLPCAMIAGDPLWILDAPAASLL